MSGLPGKTNVACELSWLTGHIGDHSGRTIRYSTQKKSIVARVCWIPFNLLIEGIAQE